MSITDQAIDQAFSDLKRTCGGPAGVRIIRRAASRFGLHPSPLSLFRGHLGLPTWLPSPLNSV